MFAPTDPQATKQQLAERYLKLGFYLLLVSPNKKTPINVWRAGSRGRIDLNELPPSGYARRSYLAQVRSTNDLTTVHAMLDEWPDAQLAVDGMCSGLFLIDKDAYKPARSDEFETDGLRAYKLLLDRYKIDPPETMRARTPSGGEHDFFSVSHLASPAEAYQDNACGKYVFSLRGLDIKWKGYVVLPSGDNGRSWINDLAPVEMPVELFAAFADLRERNEKERRERRARSRATRPATQSDSKKASSGTTLAASTKVGGNNEEAKHVISTVQLADLLGQLPVEDFRDHDLWLEIGMAAWHATGGSADGLAAFTAWSTGDAFYASAGGDIAQRWGSWDCSGKANPITVRTLIARVREAGGGIGSDVARAVYGDARDVFDPISIVELGPERKTTRTLERYGHGGVRASYKNCLIAIPQVGLCPALNDMSQNIELLGDPLPFPAEKHGRAWNEATRALTREIVLERFGAEFTCVQLDDAVLTLAVHNRYNPVVAYLENCEKQWDRVSRIDSFLAIYAHAGDSEYVRAASRLLFIGAVWRAFKPGCKYDLMLVLESDQGLGKSKLIQALGGPFAMEDLSFHDLRGKDAAEKLQGKWLVEIAELSGMKRADVEMVKAFVARQTDRYRMPYAKRADDFPRRSVLIGTTNRSNYLLDETGNRRFLPVRISGEIEIERVKSDVDQLWGEAVYFYREGVQPELPRHLWIVAAEEQAARVSEDPWCERIEGIVEEFVAKERKVIQMKELLFALGVQTHQERQGDAARISEIMERLGWRKTRSAQMDPVLERRVRGFVKS